MRPYLTIQQRYRRKETRPDGTVAEVERILTISISDPRLILAQSVTQILMQNVERRISAENRMLGYYIIERILKSIGISIEKNVVVKLNDFIQELIELTLSLGEGWDFKTTAHGPLARQEVRAEIPAKPDSWFS